MKYVIKFQRDFEVLADALDVKHAERLSNEIVSEFAPGTCKLLSIIAEDAVVEHRSPDIKPPTFPLGRPPTGSPAGTPVIRKEVLLDAIAKAA